MYSKTRTRLQREKKALVGRGTLHDMFYGVLVCTYIQGDVEKSCCQLFKTWIGHKQ